MEEKRGEISKQSFKRMPDYVRCVSAFQRSGAVVVSAPALARELALNEVQVRKDIASVSRATGKPRQGFPVDELLEDLKRCLGYDRVDEAALVGAGSIGRALMGYRGFEDYGLRIVAAFDTDPALVGTRVADKPVYAAEEIPARLRALGVKIGILTVPADAAQTACDLLVEGGALAIWNFAPAHLRAPEDILIQNENMASSLALLSQHLKSKLEEGAKT